MKFIGWCHDGSYVR